MIIYIISNEGEIKTGVKKGISNMARKIPSRVM